MLNLSVIVPVYNVKPYLSKCLDSLLSQNLDSTELILVDDGSTDGSYEILEKYALKSDHIKILQKSNGGLSDARNFGMNRAQGKYLCFIDSDDYIEANMFQTMVNFAETNHCDVVVCDMTYDYEDGTQQFSSGGDFDFSDFISNPKTITINNSACNKLFLRLLFEGVQFPVGKWYEDLATIPLILAKAQKIGHVHQTFYHYFQRLGSIAHSGNQKMFDLYEAIDSVIRTLRQLKVNEESITECMDYYYIEHGLHLTTLRIKEITTMLERNQFFEENVQHLSNYYPKWTQSPLLKTYSFKKRIVFFLLGIHAYGLVSMILTPEKTR